MLMWDATHLAAVVGGQLQAPAQLAVGDLQFNSQAILPGQVFVALRGGQRDGHEFCAQALDAGAALCLVEQSIEGPHIQVQDTLQALVDIAKAHRQAVPGRVFAMTGSMGKTTTRRLLTAILRQRSATLATQGNYNNHIGVPLTLSRYVDQHDVVLEMGANHQGEIAQLRQIGRPDIVAITLAGRAHLEGFGGIAGVIKGKGEILDELPPGGCAVLNADDPAYDTWRARVGQGRVVSFGLGHADVMARNISGVSFELVLGEQSIAVTLQLPGAHQINNALCAAAMAYADGLTAQQIKAGLESVEPEAGRGRRIQHAGITLIDDTYNANPDAMIAAVSSLLAEDPAGLAILGEMKELGEASEAAHHEVGERARELGLTRLWTTHPAIARGFGPQAQQFENPMAIQAALDSLTGQHRVLVKGSRSAAMEGCFAHWTSGE